MRGLPRRRLLVLAFASAVGGCGFQPVYMPTASGKPGPAERNLAAIHVNLIPDRPGQLLRQALQERLGSDAGEVPQRYSLAVSFGISGEGIGILTDTNATRVRMLGTADWVLRAQDAAQTRLTSGSARAIDAINILDQQYFAADLDTEHVQQRLASALADQISTQLAVYFRRRAAIASR